MPIDMQRFFEHREIERALRPKYARGRFDRIDFARETQAQDAEDVIGEGQARECVREFAVEHVSAQIAIEALETIALRRLSSIVSNSSESDLECGLEAGHHRADRSRRLGFTKAHPVALRHARSSARNAPSSAAAAIGRRVAFEFAARS